MLRLLLVIGTTAPKMVSSLYDQDDGGTPLERRALPSFAHQVRSRAGRGARGVRDSSASRVAQSIPLRPYRRVAESLPGIDRLGLAPRTSEGPSAANRRRLCQRSRPCPT